MAVETLEKFGVKYVQVMDKDGKVDEDLMPDLSDQDIEDLHSWMVRARTFDQKCFSLQRQGRMGTYAQLEGQEASQVGSAYAMEEEDWLFPSYRDNAMMMLRGAEMAKIMQYWAGDERGMHLSEDTNVFPIAIPVGSQILHAVGAAWAFKIRDEERSALVPFGDGATSKADFHEGCNFAGVFQTPVVLLCENNQFAISVPVKKQTAAETLAQKAYAYGFDGLRVDGNDVFGVYRVTKDALDKARQGGGPTLIECLTYRLGHHTTSDDASRYRDTEEVEKWKERDPIDRLEKYMVENGLIDEEGIEKVQEEAQEEVNAAVKEMESVEPPKPEDIFEYVYDEMPWNLKEQRDYLLDYLERKGEE